MNVRLVRMPFLAALASAAVLACQGSGDAPPPAGPTEVIAFGAQSENEAEDNALYLIKPDGSSLRSLSTETAPVSFPRWSPDGQRIAYIVGAEDETPGRLRVYDFEAERTTTASENALAEALAPSISWSRDGRLLAFVEGPAPGHIRIYDAELGDQTDDPGVPGTWPSWSPVEDEVAFVSSDGALSLVDADGSDEQTLTEVQVNAAGTRWSPDGRLLAFWSSPSDLQGEPALFMLDRSSGALTELGAGLAPAWSPGSLIAYSGPTQDGPTADRDILMVAAGRGMPETLARGVAVDTSPSWSPAGDRVAYLAQVDRVTAFVCVAELERRQQDCLDLPGLLPGAPAWSPQ